jgi:hypothetical protein
MRSQLDVRLGVLEPQIVHLPPDVASLAAAEETIELADSYGICDGFPLDESQKITLRAGLGERADGSWAASTVGDFEPRQNGKNDTCNARELAGLILFGEQLILHTAHEFPTANESFLRLVAIFENWDDLRKRVARIRYANGEQGIELLSGQRLKYRARTGGSGRGFAKADLVVYDEAQHLQAEHVAASGPAKLANPNSQAWYMGSGGMGSSANAWRMRRRALAGNAGRFAYVEHTAEKVSLFGGQVVSERPDVVDREAWATANPAYGRRIEDEKLEDLLGELGPELFARECLCLWDPELGAEGAVLDPVSWAKLADNDSFADDPLAFALDISPSRRSGSIAACGRREDGLLHVEVVENLDETGWMVDRMVQLVEKHRPMAVALDPGGPAGSLVALLAEVGIQVMGLPARELGQACGGFYDDVAQAKLRHLGQPELNEAAAVARKKPLGDAWRWSRKGDHDISPLYAATVARFAFLTAEQNPDSTYETRSLVVL